VHVQNAIEKGVARAEAEGREVIISALTNVAVMLNDKVAGRICIEIDPRLAYEVGESHSKCTVQGVAAAAGV
jgi:hypothetical protein